MRDFAIGNLIKSYRVRADFTQEEVARLLGIATRTYQTWEAKEPTIPPNTMLRRLADLFRLTDSEADELYRVAAQVAPEIHNLPFQPNDFFTGRRSYLEQLEQYLNKTGSVAITQPVSINGLGGIGKTELVLEYAHRHYPKVYRTVLWTNAASKTTPEASYLSLAQLLNLPEKDEHEIDRVVQAVKIWLEEHRNWLLILDNADDLPLARTFLPATPRGHVLLTTRSQVVGDIATPLVIEAMEQEEGVYFLLRRSGVLKRQDELETAVSRIRETATQLVKLLDGHPLAIDQAGAYIEATSSSFNDYIKIYHEKRRMLLNEREFPGDKHPETVVITFEVSFKRACELCPAVANTLPFCAFLHPDNIPEELLTEGLKFDIIELNNIIRALRRYSLIKRDMNAKTLTIHRLVQAVLRDGLSQEETTQRTKQVVATLDTLFPLPAFAQWSACERYILHVLACMQEMATERANPLNAISLLQKAGDYLLDRGRYPEAEMLLLVALSLCERRLEPADPLLTREFYLLGELYEQMGRYSAAKLFAWHALTNDEREREKAPVEAERNLPVTLATAQLYSALGRIDIKQGNWAEAEREMQCALAINTEIFGKESLNILDDLRVLALIYQEQGRLAEAETLCLQALSLCKQHLPQIDPTHSSVLLCLAEIYKEQKRFTEAEPLYNQALDIDIQIFGEDHIHVTPILNNLATFYQIQERYAEAEPLLIRSLAIREQVLGPDHPDTGICLYNLAFVCGKQERYSEAEKLFQQALTIACQTLSPHHQRTQTMYQVYMEFLHEKGNREGYIALDYVSCLKRGKFSESELKMYEQSLPFYQREIDICESIYGADHIETARKRMQLGEIYAVLDDDGERSLQMLQQALPIYEQHLGLDHPEAIELREKINVGRCLLGKADEDEQALLRALQFIEKTAGRSNIATATLLECLTRWHKQQGNFQSAATYGQEALEIREDLFEPDQPGEIVALLVSLVDIYFQLRQIPQAVSCAKRALALGQAIGPASQREELQTLVDGIEAFLAQKRLTRSEQRPAETTKPQQKASHQKAKMKMAKESRRKNRKH